MRYLPLTPSDRQAMLGVIGAQSINDLFVDVPTQAQLDGPIPGLPNHASEMAVERHFSNLARQNMTASHTPFFLGRARTSLMSPPVLTISSSAANS